VTDSRLREEDNTIRRRRECPNCLKRFTTYERVEERPLIVVKKDGRREQFDRNKILKGLTRACEKRPVAMDTLDRVVGEIETELRNEFKSEVPSREIGEKVIARLKEIDEVAYVRFASVYKQFTDPVEFEQELEKLRRERALYTAREGIME
jgi:transcriptional repressor NrdR